MEGRAIRHPHVVTGDQGGSRRQRQGKAYGSFKPQQHRTFITEGKTARPKS